MKKAIFFLFLLLQAVVLGHAQERTNEFAGKSAHAILDTSGPISRIRRGGGSVSISSAGAISITPTSGQGVTLEGPLNSCADAGSTDAYACSLSPAISAYNTKQTVWFMANTANTGAATISLNSLGAKTIKKNKDSDLADNDIKAGQWVAVQYDGTNFQLMSPVSNGAVEVDATTTYASLNAAAAAIGATPTILTIKGDFPLGTSPVTVPSTLILKGVTGGKITGTGTLNISSSLAVNLSNPTKLWNSTITVNLSGNGQVSLLPEWWGAVGDNSTDDSTAFNATIAAAMTAKTARIQLQNKTYLATISVPATSGAEWQSLEIDGMGHPATLQGTVVFGGTQTTHGSILRSAGTGAAVISAAGAYYGTFTLKNLTLRTYDDPNQSGFDGTNFQQAILESVQVDTGVYTASVTEPTHSTAAGIIFPPNGNASLNIGRDVLVQGYYKGIVWTEHTLLDYVQVSANEQCISAPGAGHALYATRILMQNCKYGIVAAGTTYLNIAELAIEHGVNAGFPAWQVTTYDVDDISNQLTGNISYLTGVAGASYTTIVKRNAGNLKFRDMRSPSVWPGDIYPNGNAVVGGATSVTEIFTSFPSNVSAPVIELNKGASSVSGDSNFGALSFVNNQTGTANVIGGFYFSNASLGVADKRVAGLFIQTDGATNSGRYSFFTSNAGTFAERFRVDHAGNTVLGTQAALATNATDGFAYIPTMAGTPTGTPTSFTGKVPMVFDTTNAKICIYTGGSWHCTAAF